MALVLLSFLGRGQPPRDGQSGGRSGYQQATYRFPSGKLSTATFFGWSALQTHRSQYPSDQIRWIILGTSGSTWPQLLDVVLDATRDPSLQDQGMQWAESCEHHDWGASDPAPLLSEGAAVLTKAIGCATSLDLVTESPVSVFAAVEKHVGDRDRVTLDITHGWRILPVAAIMAIDALRWLKKVRLDGIIYGAFDFPRTPEGHVPVIDLREGGIREFDDATEPLAVLELTGQYGQLAEFFPSCRSELERASFLESLHRLGQARPLAKIALDRLGQIQRDRDAGPLKGVMARRLADALRWSLEKPDASVQTLLAKAKFQASHGDWLRAAVMAFEAALLAAAPRRDFGDEPGTASAYDELRKDARQELKKRWKPGMTDRLGAIRNCAAHTDLGFAESLEQKQAPLTEPEMRRLVEEAIRFAESLERERERTDRS